MEWRRIVPTRTHTGNAPQYLVNACARPPVARVRRALAYTCRQVRAAFRVLVRLVFVYHQHSSTHPHTRTRAHTGRFLLASLLSPPPAPEFAILWRAVWACALGVTPLHPEREAERVLFRRGGRSICRKCNDARSSQCYPLDDLACKLLLLGTKSAN